MFFVEQSSHIECVVLMSRVKKSVGGTGLKSGDSAKYSMKFECDAFTKIPLKSMCGNISIRRVELTE